MLVGTAFMIVPLVVVQIDARISFHQGKILLVSMNSLVNDFDANGLQCKALQRQVKCPFVCVVDIAQCPEPLRPSCNKNEYYCADGVCRVGANQEDACRSVVSKCSCIYGFAGVENSQDVKLYPCKEGLVNISTEGPTKFEESKVT
jgi:hypothetical protein